MSETDATGSSRGASRLLLVKQEITRLGCHGLVPWSFTFPANIASNVRDSTGQARGISISVFWIVFSL
jgi:hypothetical protein